MLLNIHFQKYRYNFENYTYITVKKIGSEIKQKTFTVNYKKNQLINKASASRYRRLHWKLASVPVNAMLLWFYSDNQFFPKLRYQNDPTLCCVRWCWHGQQ